MHQAVCAHTNKPILSMYAPDSPFPVFSLESYESDAWSAHDYTHTMDFSKPFFANLEQLSSGVPRCARSVFAMENCDYVNYASNMKSCYLCFSCGECE